MREVSEGSNLNDVGAAIEPTVAVVGGDLGRREQPARHGAPPACSLPTAPTAVASAGSLPLF